MGKEHSLAICLYSLEQERARFVKITQALEGEHRRLIGKVTRAIAYLDTLGSMDMTHTRDWLLADFQKRVHDDLREAEQVITDAMTIRNRIREWRGL